MNDSISCPFQKTICDDEDWIKLSVNRKEWEISELLDFTL